MIIAPEELSQNDLPLIVFSDHSSGIVQALIKVRTKGYYNHVMWMHRPGFFASQGNTYSEVPIRRYMTSGNRLKFIRIDGLTAVQKRYIVASIEKKLSGPWWRKMYDWLGILGQATGFKRVSSPGLDYCSEDVPRHLRAVTPFLTDDNLKNFIDNIPHHGSPEDLNKYFKTHREHNTLVGRWDSDEDMPEGQASADIVPAVC